MEKRKSHELLQQAWDRAVEQAEENSARPETLDAERLNDAAGLHVKSGARAGVWGLGNTVTCEYSCGC